MFQSIGSLLAVRKVHVADKALRSHLQGYHEARGMLFDCLAIALCSIKQIEDAREKLAVTPKDADWIEIRDFYVKRFSEAIDRAEQAYERLPDSWKPLCRVEIDAIKAFNVVPLRPAAE